MAPIASHTDNSLFEVHNFNHIIHKPITTRDLFYALNTVKQNNTQLISSDLIKNQLPSVSTTLYEWPKNTRILIVEDNKINQHVARGILKEFNLETDIAINGLEALDAIKNSSPLPLYPIVFMDCQMPEMDGYEATKAIRTGLCGEENKEVTIIAMTANAMASDRENCINAGMNDYISKPIGPNILLEKLQYWLLEINGLSTQNAIKQREINSEKLNTDVSKKLNITSNKANKNWDKESALQRVKGNVVLLNKLISLFLEDMPTNIKMLQIYTKEKNITEIAETIHSIKGATGNLSVNKMYALTKKNREINFK